MKTLVKVGAVVCVFLASFLSANTQAQSQNLNIDQVLRAAQSGATQDRNAQRARENRFRAELNKERGRLRAMENERARQERISKELEARFDQNDVTLQQLAEDLRRELGDLKQLFGVIQLSASEAQEEYRQSIISQKYPERSENLREMVAKMASLTELVSIDEIEDLWFQLQNEMTEQGKIVSFSAPVKFPSEKPKLDSEGNPTDELVTVYADEDTQDRTVTRIGAFNVVSGDDIVLYDEDLGFYALGRQMDAGFVKASNTLQQAQSGVSTFQLDPARGTLLAALVQKKSIDEKAHEGGIVGYVIMSLGAIALLIALLRYIILTGVEASVRKQARDMKRASQRNALGRVLKVYQDNQKSDPESLELKLGEAMLRESPKINSWVMFIKIIAVVAPLLGLLGTVTGMIQTFQAITLYGAGDPQTMAGGISQALVTTVQGLIVAIPCVFAHWLVSKKARGIEDILEEQSAGLVAKRYERESKAA